MMNEEGEPVHRLATAGTATRFSGCFSESIMTGPESRTTVDHGQSPETDRARRHSVGGGGERCYHLGRLRTTHGRAAGYGNVPCVHHVADVRAGGVSRK